MRALITGIGGFVGRHLLAHLRAQGDTVAGLARAEDAAGLDPSVELYVADLLDREAVAAAVRAAESEAVYHLAAQSSSGDSLADPWGTLGNNLRAQLNLLEALVASGRQPRVLVVGSSEEYGHLRPEDIPTDESVPLRPVNAYAVSKVGQTAMAYQYFAQHGLPTVRVRPFSHTGPGHDARFVLPSLARQVAEAEAGLREPVLRVGNLEIERDFTDARDMVRAYRLAVRLGVPGEVYNIGRGEAVRLRDALDDLVALSRVRLEIVVDPERLRRADVPRQQANPARFQALTGWQPEIPWPVTLRDTLDDWRARVGATSVAPA